MPKIVLFVLLCAVAVGQETPSTRPSDAMPDVEAAINMDAPTLSDLAAKMVAAYAGLDSLYVESQVYESVRQVGSANTSGLTFDESAPLIATIKSWMRPSHELRTEVYVGDKLVWGMVSKPMRNGKSMAVQWNGKQITKPYPAGGPDEGRGWNCDGEVPGRCILGWHVFSLVGGKETRRDTLPSWLWKDRIANGRYEGRVKDAAGKECYCISFAAGNEVLFKHYLDPATFLITQIDKVQLVKTLGGKTAGVGTQRWTFKNKAVAAEPGKFEFPALDGRTQVEAKAH